jgi:hypothetical protein
MAAVNCCIKTAKEYSAAFLGSWAKRLVLKAIFRLPWGKKNNLFWATAQKFEGKKIALPSNHILPNCPFLRVAKQLINCLS